MPWWTWVVIGTLLLGAEMTFIDLELYLVFLGLSALGVGLSEYFLIDLPFWGEMLAFSVLSVTFMVTLRGPLYRKLKEGLPEDKVPMIGNPVVLTSDLRAGEKHRQDVRGTEWTIRNDSDGMLRKGETVQVVAVDGLTLVVA